MKFRASIKDPRAFANVCQACRSIQRRCVIKLHPQRIRFFTSTSVTDGMQVWAGCRSESLFHEFRIESRSAGNAIFFEISDLSQLIHVMRTAERCTNVVAKLGKNDKGRPVLKLLTRGARNQLDVSHDIPVRILSDSDIENISAPPLEDHVVQVVLPSLGDVTTFVEKLKAADCELITFRISLAPTAPAVAEDNAAHLSNDSGHRGSHGDIGSMAAQNNVLEMFSDSVKANFALRYNNVEAVQSGSGNRSGSDADEEPPGEELMRASVSVELKKFARLLSIKEVSPPRIVLHLVNQKALVLSVYAMGGTTLVGYMPAFVR